MIQKSLDDITLADIKALVDDEAHEGRTLDFKSQLNLRTDEEKRRIPWGVFSALANTIGGDLGPNRTFLSISHSR